MQDHVTPERGENVIAFPRSNRRAAGETAIAMGGEVLPAAESGYRYLTLYVTDEEAEAVAAFICSRAAALSLH